MAHGRSSKVRPNTKLLPFGKAAALLRHRFRRRHWKPDTPIACELAPRIQRDAAATGPSLWSSWCRDETGISGPHGDAQQRNIGSRDEFASLVLRSRLADRLDSLKPRPL